MRICVLNTSLHHGGTSVFAMDVAKGMAKRGHEVAFICSGHESGTYTQDGYLVRIIELRHQSLLFHYFNPILIRALNRFLSDFKPDVIHVHNINLKTFSLGSLLISRKYPMIWTLHDLWALCMTGWPEGQDCRGTTRHCRECSKWPRALVKANRVMKKSVYAFSRFTVVTPTYWLAELFHRSSLSHKVPHVIPYAIDTTFSTPEADRKQYRTANSKEKMILFSGGRRVNGRSPAERKGWKYLAEAVRILAKRRKDFHLLYMGDPLDLPPDFPTHVTFTGVMDRKDMQKYYNSADIFVLPTLADNCPLTVLEAMFCKTPVVATAVGGIPEIIKHDHTGLLSPPRDAGALATGIEAMLSNPSHAAEMADRAYENIMKNFTMDKMLDRYESIYGQTISSVRRHFRIAS